MQRVAQGDRAAFDELVKQHGPALQRLAAAILGDAGAKDAAQEALLAAFRHAATWRPELGPVRPWLLAIARHEAYRLRPRSQHDSLDTVPLGTLGVLAGWSADDPEAMLARAEDHERLSWAIASLAPADREVLILRDLDGVAGDQAAIVLGLDLAGMKSRLHRARLRLMAALREGSTAMAEQERTEGGLRCGQVLEVLSDYIDGSLDALKKAQVDDHLRCCAVCERFGGRFKQTVGSLRHHLGAAPAVDEATYRLLRDRWMG